MIGLCKPSLMIVAVALLWPAGAATAGDRYDDAAFDSGDPARLHEISRPRGETRIIYARPLTTRRVDTASTRLVDARRAAAAGATQRVRNRVEVYRNPSASTATREYRSTNHATQAVRTVRGEPVNVARFVDTRPDPDVDTLGNVRAQPPIARAHDSIEPANHRAVVNASPRVTHYTNRRASLPEPIITVGNSRRASLPDPIISVHDNHRDYRTRTVGVVDTYPRYYRTHRYPTYYPHHGRIIYRSGYYGGCGSHYRSYYHRHRYYHSSYSFGFKYYDGKSGISIRIGGH